MLEIFNTSKSLRKFETLGIHLNQTENYFLSIYDFLGFDWVLNWMMLLFFSVKSTPTEDLILNNMQQPKEILSWEPGTESKLLCLYRDHFDLKNFLKLQIIKLVRRAVAHLFDTKSATQV